MANSKGQTVKDNRKVQAKSSVKDGRDYIIVTNKNSRKKIPVVFFSASKVKQILKIADDVSKKRE